MPITLRAKPNGSSCGVKYPKNECDVAKLQTVGKGLAAYNFAYAVCKSQTKTSMMPIASYGRARLRPFKESKGPSNTPQPGRGYAWHDENRSDHPAFPLRVR